MTLRAKRAELGCHHGWHRTRVRVHRIVEKAQAHGQLLLRLHSGRDVSPCAAKDAAHLVARFVVTR